MLLFNDNGKVRFVKFALRGPDPQGKETGRMEQKELKTQHKPDVNTHAIITRPWTFIRRLKGSETDVVER
jgi:hypothetical protein